MSRERTFLVPIIFCFLDSLFLWGPRVGVFHACDRVRGANGCRRVDPRSKQLLIAQAFLSISCVRSGLATSVTHSNPSCVTKGTLLTNRNAFRKARERRHQASSSSKRDHVDRHSRISQGARLALSSIGNLDVRRVEGASDSAY